MMAQQNNVFFPYNTEKQNFLSLTNMIDCHHFSMFVVPGPIFDKPFGHVRTGARTSMTVSVQAKQQCAQ